MTDVHATVTTRLAYSPAIRRVLPHVVTVTALRLLDLARGGREESRREVAHLLGPGATPAEVERLAREHRRERAIRDDLLHRPSRVMAARVRDLTPLRAALAAGHGAIVASLHLDAWFAIFPALAAAGVRYVCPVTATEDLRGRSGLAVLQHRRYATLGGRIVPAEGSLLPLLAQLRRGGVTLIAFDVRGSTPTPFLGRTVGMASGIAQLAVTASAPVVPAQVRRDGRRIVVELEPALAPEGRDVDAMQRALAARMERILHERPAALEAPLARWASADEMPSLAR